MHKLNNFNNQNCSSSKISQSTDIQWRNSYISNYFYKCKKKKKKKKLRCSHYEIKASYKIIDALVLAINKTMSQKDKRIRKIKD